MERRRKAGPADAGLVAPSATSAELSVTRGRREARVLRLSLAATVVVAAGGILCGLLSGSMSLLFDGLFSGIDAVMTVVTLRVAELVLRESDRRFQFGYWHFEPLVLALNSCVLLLLCCYAFLNAVSGLMSGGHVPEFGIALRYTAVVSVVCAGMFLYQRAHNRTIRSDFIRLDMHSWLMSGAITLALLVAFSVAQMLHGTEFAAVVPLVDPAVLALLAPLLVITPVATARRALREVFLMAPRDFDRQVGRAIGDLARRRGFVGYKSYGAKVGRAEFVELHVILPENYPLSGIETLDALRREVEAALGDVEHKRWLTVVFTGDRSWT